MLPEALKDLRNAHLPQRETAPSLAAEPSQITEAQLPDAETAFEQDPRAISRVIGARHWLTLPEEGTLWEINATSRALWAMLEIPGSAHDLTMILAEDFPDIAEARILADVRQALGWLAAAGLIREAEAVAA